MFIIMNIDIKKQVVLIVFIYLLLVNTYLIQVFIRQKMKCKVSCKVSTQEPVFPHSD